MNQKLKYIYIIVTAALLNLFLLYFLKYWSNGIGLSEFNLLATGNFINLLVTFILCLGCLLLLKAKSKIHIANLKTLTFISVVYLIPLIILIILNYMNLEFQVGYFFGYPLRKIVPVLFYTVNQILLLYTLFVIFYLYAKNTLLSYLYSLISVVLLTFFFIIVSLLFTFFTSEFNTDGLNEKYDYGIVLGAAVWSTNEPSPIFTGRIDKCAQLYLDNKIAKIHLTGSNAPGEDSEAMAAKKYLEKNYDINSSDIVIEESTSTTNEQIRFVKEQVTDADKKLKIIIISDDFHLKRVEEMINFYGINAKVVSSEYKLNFQKSLYYRIRDSIGLILFWFFAI